MDAIIEGIYEDVYKKIEEYLNDEERVACNKKILSLFKEFEVYAPCAQMGLYDNLRQSVLDNINAYGLTQFKGGFKMGFKLACECLKV